MSFLLQKIFDNIVVNFWDAKIFYEKQKIEFTAYGKTWVVTLKEKNNELSK